MRGTLITLSLAALLLAGPASAAPGDVAGTLPLPFNHPTGVAWTGERFWVADRKTAAFYEIDPSTASVTATLESPAWSPSGLAWHDGLLWSTDPDARAIYATEPLTGRTVRTLTSHVRGATGIAWNGDQLWICDNDSDMILHIDSYDGTTIVSFPSPAGDPRGIVFGGGYLWCTDRLRDEIHMLDPRSGLVLMTLDAPGPFPWGLAWKNGRLFCSDYQHDALYELVADDSTPFSERNPRSALIDFTTRALVTGSGGAIETLEIFYAVPGDRPGQRLLEAPEFSPAPRMTADLWQQKIAAFAFTGLEPGTAVEVTMRARALTSAVRFHLFPEKVGTKIPAEISRLYLADDAKYDISHPYIQEIVREVAGDEPNLYWRARRLYQYLIENMEYELAGGWNTAPTVLKRGTGSCSEYTFALIALLRASGIPARYVGALVVRGDDASYDDVFHRWAEIYLPGYGWVPVDANAGDRPLPADQGAAFGGVSNRFLVTTEGAGGSEYLGWSYNYKPRWVSTGKCGVQIQSVAEWRPLESSISP